MLQEKNGSANDDTRLLKQGKSKSTNISYECKVCKELSTFYCYGIPVCPSCKMFFRRNAENKEVGFYQLMSFNY